MAQRQRAVRAQAATDDEEVLYHEHPAMFGNRPILFVVCLILCAAGVGLLCLGWWWLHCQGVLLEVTNRRSTLRTGILSRALSEVWHREVCNIKLEQTFSQRLMHVGTIGISSAGEPGFEILVSGMPHPETVKEIIDAYRQNAR
ncbi:MAG: PH domain-containing protein [Phycisphaeraceae bacterium]|nr:PH domain-containing protein [Phycisphaeraceae bacterium]